MGRKPRNLHFCLTELSQRGNVIWKWYKMRENTFGCDDTFYDVWSFCMFLVLFVITTGGREEKGKIRLLSAISLWFYYMPTYSNMGDRLLQLDLWGSDRQQLPGYKVALLGCFPTKLQIWVFLVRLLMGGKTVLQDLELVSLWRHFPVNSGCPLESSCLASAVVAVLHLSIKEAGLESWFGFTNCGCPLWLFVFSGFIWGPVTLKLCLILISLTTFVRQKTNQAVISPTWNLSGQWSI